MISKLKEYIMNLPAKSAMLVLCVVFILAVFASKWYSYQSQTIAQTMVLHHDKERKLTQKELQIISIERKKVREMLGFFYCPELTLDEEKEEVE